MNGLRLGSRSSVSGGTASNHTSSQEPTAADRTSYRPRVKICGLTDIKDVEAVNRCLPDYVGLVFAESRRLVTVSQAKALRAAINRRIAVVGVFVDESLDRVADLASAGLLDIAQLYGNYQEQQIAQLRQLPEIQAVIQAVAGYQLNSPLQALPEAADFWLFDSPAPGSGHSFDWTALARCQQASQLSRPFFLAGGIDAGNLEQALALMPYAVDISSGVETAGRKDAQKIFQMVRRVRTAHRPDIRP
jgi:phosphoribosylanthranilate isomerase